MRWDVKLYRRHKIKIRISEKFKIKNLLESKYKKKKVFLPNLMCLCIENEEKEEERNVLVDTDYTHCTFQ